MQIEIIDQPFQVLLFGFGGEIAGGDIPTTGKRLMDKMWNEIQAAGIKTQGINHWVYLPQSRMFSGVQAIQAVEEVESLGVLEKLEVRLGRHLRYVHRGEYSKLPQVWKELMVLLNDRGLRPTLPNLEVYGHWNPDPAQCETTILIGLAEGNCSNNNN